MQIKFFTIPITAVSDHNEEINSFLRVNKVVEMEKQLIQTPNGVYWCMYFSYLPSTVTDNSSKEKIDYMKTLEPEVFNRFSKLRELRKKIASDEGISAYVIFTDAELAEIAKLTDISISKLKGIKGIGDKKVGKYAESIVKVLKAESDETSGKVDANDNVL